ncbi:MULTISPECIES: GNAT family N-acetyltransferase [unclassified Rathayibacter]|uniref:GNAT family N-acetyltransferase n=1 Tax=unclassified Rathayibacter TaxID=2609250 RepID=UPI0006F44448|nr:MULTISPECIES: GNAT family N-acetyltransferase [unclassified Rathayibacter]KQQ06209.1 hypothetical protein ASF42_06765 [Rathayibacter sp. Leaf294]KQS14065.1 hypothetical protein ASG06_06770 [Rathayibacter sp. Leaf185]
MTARLLDHLASAAWPPLERRDLSGWQLRAASGVTKRANSVLTSGFVPDVSEAVGIAEAFAADRGIPPLFQIGPASDPADLPGLLAARGYEPHDRTLVLTGSVTEALAALPEAPVETSAAPDDDWLALWWSVDGRGGDPEREVARRILEGCDSSYALLRDEHGVAACGRLAHVGAPDGEQWSGLFALATRPDARRRGYASAIIRALLAHARGDRFWLQVLEGNAGARRLYASLGCRETSWYEYWR